MTQRKERFRDALHREEWERKEREYEQMAEVLKRKMKREAAVKTLSVEDFMNRLVNSIFDPRVGNSNQIGIEHAGNREVWEYKWDELDGAYVNSRYELVSSEPIPMPDTWEILACRKSGAMGINVTLIYDHAVDRYFLETPEKPQLRTLVYSSQEAGWAAFFRYVKREEEEYQALQLAREREETF